jgi:hypothetical protein
MLESIFGPAIRWPMSRSPALFPQLALMPRLTFLVGNKNKKAAGKAGVLSRHQQLQTIDVHHRQTDNGSYLDMFVPVQGRTRLFFVTHFFSLFLFLVRRPWCWLKVPLTVPSFFVLCRSILSAAAQHL